jgi:glycerol-3-phosphate acyltransferase PlsY
MPNPISWSFAMPYLLAAFAFGYLLGSIPWGLLLTRMAGLGDIRAIGSGNIGATNVLRTGRKGIAAATLLLDALKGMVAVWIAGRYAGPDGVLVAGLGAMLGHILPVWLGFRGGKGVATGLGVLIAVDWTIGLAACVTWLVVAALFRKSSLASLAATAFAPIYALILPLAWAPPGVMHGDRQIAEFAALIALAVWIKHYGNIKRLIAGTEPRIGQR